MVEYKYDLDLIYQSLADGTRRDMLTRTLQREQTISELAELYHMSFAAVAKHVTVLERAELVSKRKEGRQQIVSINKKAFEFAAEYLKRFERLWQDRFDKLDSVLKVTNNDINKEKK